MERPQNVVAARESPLLNAETSGAEKKLLCTVSGKTATPRRLVSRIRLRHAIAAGLFSSTAPEHAEPRVTPFAPSGDGGPANGTAPQSEAGGHQATRTSAAHLGVCCKTELAAPTSGASTGPLASPRPARWVVATATSGEAIAEQTIGSGGGSKSRSSRTPAQGGKCDLHRKPGVARGRPQTSDLPPNGSGEATCGRAKPPIPKGFRGSREPRHDRRHQTEA